MHAYSASLVSSHPVLRQYTFKKGVNELPAILDSHCMNANLIHQTKMSKFIYFRLQKILKQREWGNHLVIIPAHVNKGYNHINRLQYFVEKPLYIFHFSIASWFL